MIQLLFLLYLFFIIGHLPWFTSFLRIKNIKNYIKIYLVLFTILNIFMLIEVWKSFYPINDISNMYINRLGLLDGIILFWINFSTYTSIYDILNDNK